MDVILFFCMQNYIYYINTNSLVSYTYFSEEKMGELKQTYLLIQKEILKNNFKEALDIFEIYHSRIKDIKGFQNFVVSVVSTLAQKLQSELNPSNQNTLSAINTYDVIQLADCCFKILVLSDLKSSQNSLYVIVRYLLVNNITNEAVHFCNYLLKNSSPPNDTVKLLIQLFAHYIHKNFPIDDDLKKSNVILMWNTSLNLVKYNTEKEIEYALNLLTSIIKNNKSCILHEGRSMDLVIIDMTLESVLTSSVFRKKSDQDNMMFLYSILIENIAAVMQNMMYKKQLHVYFLTKHIELMIDVCCLEKTEKEALSFLISLFKFIDNSKKNGLDSNFELKKMIKFIQKYESTKILPNTILHYVFKVSVITMTKLKNLWYDGLIINSSETTSQVLILLQQLVFLSKHISVSQICCKSNNCDLKEDSTSEMSLINIVFIIARHIIATHNTFLNLEDVLKWMELFTSLFERVSKSNCANKIPFIEFSLTSAYNLCIYTTSSEFTNLCFNFLENLYSILDPSGIDSDLVARVAVLLSRYLYNKDKKEEALRCIAYWCVRTRSELTAQQWVYLKCKEEKSNRIVNKTMLHMFENDIDLKKKWPEYSLNKSDYNEIMWLELKAHSHQHKVKQDTSAVLEIFKKLIGNTLPRELKCRVIITTAYIILHSNSINGLKTVNDVLEDYIRKLEVEISLEKKMMPLLLGNLYYANFMCLTKNLQNLVGKELDSCVEDHVDRGMEQQNFVQYGPMSWILPLKIKPKLFKCLNLAVKNWSLTNDTIKDEYDVKILYKSLQEVAFIFKLYCDPKEVEVWQLLYKLASDKKCHAYTFTALSELIKIGKTDVVEFNNLAKKLPKMAVDYKLTLATSLLNQFKFKDAQLLLEAIDTKQLNNNLLLMAEYSYLKSRWCYESGNMSIDKCLCTFIEAYNLSHGLIKQLNSYFEYLNMHFVLLSICSYLNLIYIHTFRPVEARCFLKVQMNIVLKSVLTKRALNVFMMNCWNELMCYNFENAYVQLEHVMTLLDFKEDELDSKLHKLTVSNSSNILSSPLSNYRCLPNQRINKMASPSSTLINNKTNKMSFTEFCEDTIVNNKTLDPIIIHSVVEACILRAVYCSKANQLEIAENYFRLVFKLLEFASPIFNKNEVYNILAARQNSLVSFYYAEHLICFNDLSKSLDYIKKTKELYHDEWLLLNVRELSISLKIDNIMKIPKSRVIHSPKAKLPTCEIKTPAIAKVRVKPKSQAIPRLVTPAVRKLRMTLDSPLSKENKLKSSSIKEPEKKTKDSVVKKKSGKENIVQSTTKNNEIKVRETRSTKKIDQPSQTITKRSRLNI